MQSLTQLFRKDSLLKSLLQTNYFFFYFTSLSLSNLSMNFHLNFFLQTTASDFSSSLLTTTRLLRRESIIFIVIYKNNFQRAFPLCGCGRRICQKDFFTVQGQCLATHREARVNHKLQKGGVPATPSGTATLLRLSPSHQFRPRPLLSVTNFRRPRLPWLDGRCVQGPGTYSPRHG